MDNNTVAIALNENQVKALGRLGMSGDDVDKFITSAVNAQLKSKFKYYAEAAKERLGKVYDDAVTNGFSAPDDRETFIAKQVRDTQDILANL